MTPSEPEGQREVRPAVARLLLPGPVATARVLPSAAAWREPLAQAGIEALGARRAQGPDLVVAGARDAARAVAERAQFAIVEGGFTGRRLAGHYRHVRRIAALPSLARPEILVPLDARHALNYAFTNWFVPTKRWKQARNALLHGLLARRALARFTPALLIASSSGEPPVVLAAADEHAGVAPDGEWFLATGGTDPLARSVFYVFARGSAGPTWAVKVAPVPSYAEPFERDERGLRLAAAAGEVIAAHAPRLLSRFTVAGVEASVESAAVGSRVTSLLAKPGASTPKLRLIDEIAAWIVEMGSATRAPAAALAPERARLHETVVPQWRDALPADVVKSLPPIPAVLQHNDLGCWNIVADDGKFTVVDWESAREHGFALWDLLYFLLDALSAVDGVRAAGGRVDRAVRLFRGELPVSRILFEWIRRALPAFEIPEAAVGTIATLCWLHHEGSHAVRASRARSVAVTPSGDRPLVERFAHRWLREPGLGLTWRAGR